MGALLSIPLLAVPSVGTLANLVSLSSSSRSQDHAVEQRHALQSAVPAESSKTGAIHSRSSAENLGLT
ncbi:uncharacterized protein N7529_010447 [Penicillium soppii]|uniref:uncharacterized protein n=1 Tax=Penicillium soppii TaxID=69789 RepID=UPI002549924C|nr:uncharacterized protein N7529_010447 [Penicillium soppii]KAJ5856503.1 hypothetical protein N7529_010447 [Penicillium soppii]